MPRTFDMILFGASGNVSLNKLLPAVYRTFKEKKISHHCRLFLCCKERMAISQFLETVEAAIHQAIPQNEIGSHDCLQAFMHLIQYVCLDISAQSTEWRTLADQLSMLPDRPRLFYLAIPSSQYSQCCQALSQNQLISKYAKLVLENPIGFDERSAIKINDEIARWFDEGKIFRIDHYLGKETVQNMLALRFSNSLFEQFWGGHAIDHIQITISESQGIEGRTDCYDHVGALRDMVQNHLLQLLCLVAMDNPNELSAKHIRYEKLKVLKSLRPIKHSNVDKYTVRGQYTEGKNATGNPASYLSDADLKGSHTETFVAIKAYIDNWRWAKVPFYLRTGKRLARKSAEIVVQFNEVSHNLFPEQTAAIQPNRMIIQLQPEERLQLVMMTKDMTKLGTVLKPSKLDLNFTDQIKGYRSYAYNRLLIDIIDSNQRLFVDREEVIAAWQWIDPIINYWKKNQETLHLYDCGSMGPKRANTLMANDARQWVELYHSSNGI